MSVQAPFYKVWVEGNPLWDISDKVERIKFEDCISGEEDSFAQFDLYLGYNAIKQYDTAFVTGRYIAFQFGLGGGPISEIHKMRVVDVETHYKADKLAVTLRCLDKAFIMRRVTRQQIDEDGTTEEILRKRLIEYNMELQINADLSRKYHALPQGNRSDMSYFHYLMNRETGGNMICYIRNDVFYVDKRNMDGDPVLAFEWGNPASEIISFKAKNHESKKTGAYNNVRAAIPLATVPSTDTVGATIDSIGKGEQWVIRETTNETEELETKLGKYNIPFNQALGIDANNEMEASDEDDTESTTPKLSDYGSLKGERKKTVDKYVYDKYGSVWGDPDSNTVKEALINTGLEPATSKALFDPSNVTKEIEALTNTVKKNRKGILGTLVTNLRADIRPNVVVTMSNVIAVHAGNWLVYKATHEIEKSGGTTTFEMEKNGTKVGTETAKVVNNAVGPDTKTDTVTVPAYDFSGNKVK